MAAAAAIAAGIGAAITGIAGIAKMGANKLAGVREDQRASLVFEQQKEGAVYDLMQQKQNTLMVIVVLGMAFIGLVFFMGRKK